MAKQRKTIFLIEDEPAIIDIYKTAITKTNRFKVEVITSGRGALEKMKKIEEGSVKAPRLILLDLILPDINGIEILKEIRKNRETKDIPVFILTNYSDKKLQEIAQKLKVDKYIIKTDISLHQLVNFVKDACQ